MLLYFFILSSLCLLVLKSLFIYLFYFCHYIQVLFSYLITYLFMICMYLHFVDENQRDRVQERQREYGLSP